MTTLPKTLMSRSLSAVLLLVLGLAAMVASANPGSAGRKPYTPERGQPGKDVMWIPTPQGLIDRMLEMGKVTSRDRLYDLGAGDGILPITAARRFGPTGVGIEYTPPMVEFAPSQVEEAGVGVQGRCLGRWRFLLGGGHAAAVAELAQLRALEVTPLPPVGAGGPAA